MTLADLYDEPGRNPRGTRRRKVAEYPYCDEHGEVLFLVERWEPGKNGHAKDFLRARPGGAYGARGIRQVLYRLPAVLQEAAAAGTVLVVEGEKDVDSLTALSTVATCSPGGAGKWRDEYSQALRGASQVVVIADRDEPGRRHAGQVADSLRRAGIPVVVKEPATGKDVTDHLAAGLGFDDLVDADPRPTIPTMPPRSQDSGSAHVSGDSGTRIDDEWDEPIPVDVRPLPPFPTQRLGELAEFVDATAASLQVPPDLVAFAALATISTATGGRRQVRVKPDWHESLALYLAALADSSDKKTPALNAAAAPLRRIETELIEAAMPDLEATAQEIRITQGRMAKAEQKAVNADRPEDALADAESARMKLLELGETPAPPRLLIRDATLEAISMRMAENGGRIGTLASEAGLLKVAAGMYGNKGQANTDLLLEAYTGSPYTIDRTGRASARMDRTFIAIGLLLQPGVLAGIETKNPEFRENGLLGRFLYARPAPTTDDTFDSPAVPPEIAAAYSRRIRAIVERVWRDDQVLTLELDEGARALFADFYNDFASRRKPGGDLHTVADWAGKFRGQLIRIAACLTVYEAPSSTLITRDRMADVLALAPYLIAHAKAVFDLMGADSETRLTPLRDLLAWLRGRPEPTADFSARDAWQAVKGRRWAKEMEDVSDALGDLEEHGWIAALPPPERPPGSKGRKRSPRFAAHPKVAAANA
ncbi:DUF3987 domain-containing protein [Embleya sp. NPDC056575]|uniref:DUF3987 domain-containing protein n=1 Tax=unclassified Embleya TaxID=2699296 RepID=UPI00368A5C77